MRLSGSKKATLTKVTFFGRHLSAFYVTARARETTSTVVASECCFLTEPHSLHRPPTTTNRQFSVSFSPPVSELNPEATPRPTPFAGCCFSESPTYPPCRYDSASCMLFDERLEANHFVQLMRRRLRIAGSTPYSQRIFPHLVMIANSNRGPRATPCIAWLGFALFAPCSRAHVR
jgi:hypothetical protein